MSPDWNIASNAGKLSVKIVSAFLLWWIALWAILTPLTFISQLTGISFQYYSYISLLVFLFSSISLAISLIKSCSKIESKDKDVYIVIGLMVLFLAGIFVSLSYHTTGRLFLDDFYLIANPVYYSEHAQALMGFEARTFYSGKQPIISAAFLTAGSYEYILAIPAYLLHVQYIIIYYRFAAVFNSLFLVFSVYLLLSRFSEDTASALLGTFVVLCLLVVMSENSWAIGGLSYIHVYEGKSILLIDSIPLAVVCSLDYLNNRTMRTWSILLGLITGMTGMSTSSLMVLPLFGVITFFSHTFTFRKNYDSSVPWIICAFSYFGSYAYLIVFGIFVSFVDKIGNALIFNISYPDNFDGYLKAFLASSTWPATSLLASLFCIAALVILSGQRRTFVLLWIILSIGLALNPITAQVLLLVFRGIYFRLFYIIFHPLFAGMVAASISFLVEKRYSARWRSASFVVIALIAIASTILSSSSIFINPRYEFGNWTPTDDYPPAKKIANITPEGVMLAPYPISGTIRMISSNYPQMEARDDIVSFYLGLQGRVADANIRLQANDFLQGQMQDFQAFAILISNYPEIRSVVFSSGGFANLDSNSINLFLTSNDFLHNQKVGKYIVYWR